MILFIKHIDIEGPGTLGEFFEQTAWTVKTVNLHKGEELPPLDLCEAIVSLGGPMNVYETDIYPFLEVEEDFLKNALKKNIPILGICLGGQLLAKILRGKVEKSLASNMAPKFVMSHLLLSFLIIKESEDKD